MHRFNLDPARFDGFISRHIKYSILIVIRKLRGNCVIRGMNELAVMEVDLPLHPIQYFDSHCHLQLDAIYSQRHRVISTAKDRGVHRFATCATCPGEDWGRIEYLSSEYSHCVHASYGLHPLWINDYINSRVASQIKLTSKKISCCRNDKSLTVIPDNCVKLNDPVSICSECQVSLPPSSSELNLTPEEIPSASEKFNELSRSDDSYITHLVLNEISRDLTSILTNYPNAGVGEFGIDKRLMPGKKSSRYSAVPLNRQIAIFEAHLAIAIDLQRPATIHCVGCWGTLFDSVSEVIKKHCSILKVCPPIILHSCNTISIDVAKRFAKLENIYFSFCGSHLTDKILDILRIIPPKRLLIESDSPDQMISTQQIHQIIESTQLAPIREYCSHLLAQSYSNNEPSLLPLLCEYLAQKLGISHSELAHLTETNSSPIFAFPKHG